MAEKISHTDIELRKVGTEYASLIRELQIAAFSPLLNKYHDYDMSPACEDNDTIKEKILRPGTDTYIIIYKGKVCGSLRICMISGKTGRYSSLCVLPEFQGRGIASFIMNMIETMYPQFTTWELDTILEEKDNCHLYEKMGFAQVGKIQNINENMNIVFYRKG